MHKLQMYENLRDMLEQEISKIQSRGELDPQGLDNLFKLMTTLKNTDKCIDREEGSSYRMMPTESYGYMRDGRYSGDNFRDRSYRRGSYEPYNGISRDDSRQMMRSKLEMLMNEATNENERQAIMDCMNRM